MSGPWDAATLRARIADAAHHRRWAAGSPNEHEITAYAAAIPADHPRKRAVVFGMTPELRQMAVATFDEVISVDRSSEAHALYGDWVTVPPSHREKRIEQDWLAAPWGEAGSADIAFGDGIFGNCRHDLHAGQLLDAIRSTLAPHGLLITRHACYPAALSGVQRSWRDVIIAHEAGTLDDDEAGFALRMTALVDTFWDEKTCHLDCAAIFARLRELHAAGAISDRLHAVCMRYHFAGTNWIPDDRRWQALLARQGWLGRRLELSGKDWYRYYPFYVCGAALTGRSQS